MTDPKIDSVEPASFRDPCGFLFRRNGELYRQVNLTFRDDYDALMQSGLYAALASARLLIPHQETGLKPSLPDTAYKVIRPEPVQFISYPYEWCFSQYRDAALATLDIQVLAIKHGMSLRDCSAYNMQFHRGRPVFIDTLSFERYREGSPWVAYRQFCQHFLAPLALMSRKDIRLGQLMRLYIDGIPLDLASALLPFGTRFSPLLAHIHLHSASQKKYEAKPVDVSNRRVSKLALLGIVDSLMSAVKGLAWKPSGTEWAEYYTDTNYSAAAFQHKKDLIAGYLDKMKPLNVWDLGGNVGVFSRLASDRGIETVSCDIDPAAVEKNYLDCRSKAETHILPLVIDLTNPSPGTGWANTERTSLMERGPADMVLALALVHHLAISNNVPLDRIAHFFSRLGKSLIVEFVPKTDSQVKRLLATREDIFPDYTKQGFEQAFSQYFVIAEASAIRDSERTLYLMRKA